jgi:hypothetical protein
LSRHGKTALRLILIIFISLTDLISAKEASGRPQDLIDLKKLKKVLDKNNNAKKKKK